MLAKPKKALLDFWQLSTGSGNSGGHVKIFWRKNNKKWDERVSLLGDALKKMLFCCTPNIYAYRYCSN